MFRTFFSLLAVLFCSPSLAVDPSLLHDLELLSKWKAAPREIYDPIAFLSVFQLATDLRNSVGERTWETNASGVYFYEYLAGIANGSPEGFRVFRDALNAANTPAEQLTLLTLVRYQLTSGEVFSRYIAVRELTGANNEMVYLPPAATSEGWVAVAIDDVPKFIRSDHPEVRRLAARILGTIPTRENIELLYERFLIEERGDLRTEIISVLGAMYEKKYEALTRRARWWDPDKYVRRWSAYHIYRRRGGTDATPPHFLAAMINLEAFSGSFSDVRELPRNLVLLAWQSSEGATALCSRILSRAFRSYRSDKNRDMRY